MPHKSVTQRYVAKENSNSQVTCQYQSETSIQITQRYIATADTPASISSKKKTAKRPGLACNTLIAERYCIQDGPLGNLSGEADVYQCLDNINQQIVAVKLYYYHAVPKEDVILILQQLNHPNIITLFEYGEWQGRFYEVMQFCAGGVMSDYMPLSEAEIKKALTGIIHALNHCHRQGIIHRDIKPNNLFFNNAEERKPLLGDFGISSYLQQNTDIRQTQTAANLTLDYAAPELLDGHEVSAKTDYYSLGITLLHLLRGISPFYGLNKNDILVNHLRGRVPLPDNLSLEFHQLLRGLTLPNPQDRWGYNEVLAWLRGENVALRLDSLQYVDPDKGGKPYPGYPQVRTAEDLAQSLDKFDAFKQLQRGDIRRWIFDNVNQNLAEEIETLETNYDERPELALYKLKGLLAPDTALLVAEHRIESLGMLLKLLKKAESDSQLAENLRNILWNEYLESWLMNHKPAGERNAELVEKVVSLRKRLQYKAPETALFALRYTLEPEAPVKINDKLQFTTPQTLSILFKKAPKVVERFLTEFIYSKRFEEWLRAGEFANWQNDLDFIENTRRFYLDQKKMGTYCVLWRYYPDLPFQFAQQQITDPIKLAEQIDASAENTEKGITILNNGWLRAWLVGTGKITATVELDQALLDTNNSDQSKLEAILHLLNPQLAYPELHSHATELNFQRLYYGESKTLKWTLSNRGRGYLNGEIILAHYGSGLFLDKYLVEGNYQDYEVTVKVMKTLKEGIHNNTLQVCSNGGNIDIPVRFIVRNPPEEKSSLLQGLLDRLL